jgi:RNA polymerase sigma-70 factor (ECF subfamily)
MSPISDPFRDEMVALIPRLRRFARALVGSADAADDLVQLTLERALARAHQWQQGTRLDSWLYRIAQNLWIDETRRARRRGVEVDIEEAREMAGPDGRAAMDQRLRLMDVERAMTSLPCDQRAVVALVLIEGLSYGEAAKVLDVPAGTIASRLARAKAALEDVLAGTAAGLAGAGT